MHSYVIAKILSGDHALITDIMIQVTIGGQPSGAFLTPDDPDYTVGCQGT